LLESCGRVCCSDGELSRAADRHRLAGNCLGCKMGRCDCCGNRGGLIEYVSKSSYMGVKLTCLCRSNDRLVVCLSGNNCAHWSSNGSRVSLGSDLGYGACLRNSISGDSLSCRLVYDVEHGGSLCGRGCLHDTSLDHGAWCVKDNRCVCRSLVDHCTCENRGENLGRSLRNWSRSLSRDLRICGLDGRDAGDICSCDSGENRGASLQS